MSPKRTGRIPSRLAQVGSSSVIVGLAATPQSLGYALVIGGTPVVPESRKLGIARTTQTLDDWIEGVLRSHEPAAVAITMGDRVRRALRPEIVQAGIDVTLDEIAAAIGADAATRAGICRALARQHRAIAAQVRSCPRVQTATERYHEAGILAAGAALTIFSEFEKFSP